MPVPGFAYSDGCSSHVHLHTVEGEVVLKTLTNKVLPRVANGVQQRVGDFLHFNMVDEVVKFGPIGVSRM
jgi:hypothetical protein